MDLAQTFSFIKFISLVFALAKNCLCSHSVKVPYVPEGLEAIIFTADGDMRQALNNMQATFSGFRFVNQENVFKVRYRALADEVTSVSPLIYSFCLFFFRSVTSLTRFMSRTWFAMCWKASLTRLVTA